MNLIKKLFGYFSNNVFLQGREIADIVFSLVLAIAIAIIISQIYKHTHRGMNFELAFMTTLVLLAPIVAIVMLFIRGDLVLSLGLIGSLSIIRFRTPIKDTRDMVFLFWVIAIGLGCGTFNWTVVIISTIIITILMYLLYFIKYGRSRNTDFILVVTANSKYKDDDNTIEKIIYSYTKDARIRSHESDSEHWEVIFELRFPVLTGQVTKKMINEIKSVKGVEKVSLLAPQLALPV